MICLTILFRNIEYVGATVIRPWTLVIVIFIFAILVMLPLIEIAEELWSAFGKEEDDDEQ